MIRIENITPPSTDQWGMAILGARNPMNSWNKSDSQVVRGNRLEIGENDLNLMKKLVVAGTDHSKFLRFLPVVMDITAPLYWWNEFDTYKVETVANSCSTMHKIAAKEFTIEDFSCEHLNRIGTSILWDVIDILNIARKLYLDGGNYKGEYYIPKDKRVWWQMIQLLPSSYNQKRTIMLNYEVLAGIYPMRKNHKLDEWVEFCKWIESLPYSEIIVGEKAR